MFRSPFSVSHGSGAALIQGTGAGLADVPGFVCGYHRSVYTDELEDIPCPRLKETGKHDFQRGVKDPSVYRCIKTGTVAVRHIGGARCVGSIALLNRFIVKDVQENCETTTGPL